MNLLEDAVLLDWESQKKCLRHQGKKKRKEKEDVCSLCSCKHLPLCINSYSTFLKGREIRMINFVTSLLGKSNKREQKKI